MARIATISDSDYKIVKTVEGNTYTAFCFFWGGPFRAIYSVRRELDETVGRFTIWALDKTTGIWGCFADAHDLGFDHAARFARQLDKTPINERDIPSVLEAVEDVVLFEFIEESRKHINELFQEKPVARLAIKDEDAWLEYLAEQIPVDDQPVEPGELESED